MSLTDRLKEIRARLDAATPGPWLLDDSEQFVAAENKEGDTDLIGIANIFTSNSDSQFIASSPADISLLLSVVEILLKYTQKEAEYECYVMCSCQMDAESALAKAEQLVDRGEK